MWDTQTISSLGPLIRSGRLPSERITDACLERIAGRNDELKTFITVLADEARAQAREADREIASGRWRGPLHGIPISLKDLLDARGVSTTAASRVRSGHVARADAPAIARLREAGAVFVGKCNLHEFAFGTTSEDSAFGAARNPVSPDRSPGGSSGGSAASIAAGMALASIGTDTGGSIRIPAAACGTVGLKPTLGEIPCDGVVPLCRSMDHVGPLARSVRDAWLLYEVMSGGTASGDVGTATRSIAGLRLGVLRRYFMDVLDDEVRQQCEAAIDRLRAAGAVVQDVAVPHAPLIAPVYLHIGLAEAAAYHAATLDSRPHDYTPPVRLRLEMGRYILAQDYVRATRGRLVLQREVDAALEGHDALVLPTLPIPAPLIGATSVTVGTTTDSVRNLTLRLTQLFNLTGHPAISLPAGRTAEGLPCALQLVGARGRTRDLLSVALACEPQITGA